LDFAKFLQSKGRFKEAEDNFLKGGRPKEAIDMYILQEDYEAASRVADLFHPSAITDIQV
jgi:intraflagellar transport protein 172